MTPPPATKVAIAELSAMLRAGFPAEPLPRTFWNTGAQELIGDIPDELARTFMHRRWVDVALRNWQMIGPPVSVPYYLHPDAFRYYLPSLLVGVLQDIGYVDWALGLLLPAGRKRRTDRPDWQQFWQGLSETQRDTIRHYLKQVRSIYAESADPVVQHLFDELEAVWGRP